MDNHLLSEKVTGLASRVNNLAVATIGRDSRRLLELEDELAKLAMLAIKMDLNAESPLYQEAVEALELASNSVEAAIERIDEVAKAIESIAQGITTVRKILT